MVEGNSFKNLIQFLCQKLISLTVVLHIIYLCGLFPQKKCVIFQTMGDFCLKKLISVTIKKPQTLRHWILHDRSSYNYWIKTENFMQMKASFTWSDWQPLPQFLRNCMSTAVLYRTDNILTLVPLSARCYPLIQV